MTVLERQVTDRLTRLRAALLAGRGPGASPSEIDEHTRDRPLLHAVPPTVGEEEREASAPGVPTRWPGGPTRLRPIECRHSQGREVFAGALMGLIAGVVVLDLIRSVRHLGRAGSRGRR